MWPYKPKPPKPQTEKPKYEIGDKVRIWKVLKNPTGRVQDVIEDTKGATKFNVYYEYHDGRYFTEIFEATDLTLVEKYSKKNCNCGSNTSRHSDWCNKILYPHGY